MDKSPSQALVMVVDDDVLERMGAADMFLDAGYRVLEAASPGDALEIARQNPDIQVLLTDMVMPEMGGPQLADIARKICPGIKVIFMSGYLDLPQVQRHGSDPEADYLQKPFDVTLLAATLRGAIDGE